jgi:TatD DNase family protein
MLIDSHCHLEWDAFDADRDEVVARAAAAGVERLLTVGTNAAAARQAVAIAARYPGVYAAGGVHPHDAQAAGDNAYAEIAALARAPKFVAYGEIGLDFFKNYSPRDAQLAAFRRQIRLARELDLPLIIHDRDAHAETLAMLRAEGGLYRGVFHCFAGDEPMAEEVLALGFHISFTGNITFRKFGGRDAASSPEIFRVLRACPADRLLLETDSPFLTPHPHRGKRNEPAFVRFVAEKAAALRGVSVDELAQQTSTNAYRLFRFETFGRRGEIVYEHKNALYVNLTSRCTNRCGFCAKMPDFVLGSHYLYLPLDEEPEPAAVIAAVESWGPDAISSSPKFSEIVFCGYGEPTLRWAALLEIAAELKKRGAPRLRLNTNGLADLIVGRPVAAECRGLLDAVSVSLNAADAETYEALCRPKFGSRSLAAIVEFIAQAKQFVPEVTATAVRCPGVDLAAVRKFAEEILRVPFRVRG